jgi:hypothetical protein
MPRYSRRPRGRGALGAFVAAAVLCAGGVGVAVFGLASGTPADAGATVIPASVSTAVPKAHSHPAGS